MIKASNVVKRFGGRTVIDGAAFVVNDGERAGVVGPNGSGKTTLLRLLAGELAADAGAIQLGHEARVGYLRQGYAGLDARPVAEVFAPAFEAAIGEVELERLSAQIAAERGAARAALEEGYERVLAGVAQTASSRAPQHWRELGLRPIAPNERAGNLSGGEQTKLGLICVAASRPDVLLLDEPTNNLDLDALAWVDAYLVAFAGPVVFVSHDRTLLDGHATQILELDPRTGRLESFPGNYEDYASEKARRESALWDRFRRQQEHERRVRREIRDIKSTASRREAKSQNDFYRRKAKKVARRAVVLERRLARGLEGEARIEKPIRHAYRVKAELGPATRAGDRMLAAGDVSVSLDGAALLKGVDLQLGWAERVVLTGPNGSGKSTLLNVLAGERAPDAGDVRLSPSARIGYLRQAEPHEDAVDAERTPVDEIRAAAGCSETEARRFLHRFLFSGDDALTPIARLSYGERRRLALARLVLSGANLLLLDEPTNHLDIPSREAFEAALETYPGAMLAVTHDRYFIERFAGRLLSIEDGKLRDL